MAAAPTLDIDTAEESLKGRLGKGFFAEVDGEVVYLVKQATPPKPPAHTGINLGAGATEESSFSPKDLSPLAEDKGRDALKALQYGEALSPTPAHEELFRAIREGDKKGAFANTKDGELVFVTEAASVNITNHEVIFLGLSRDSSSFINSTTEVTPLTWGEGVAKLRILATALGDLHTPFQRRVLNVLDPAPISDSLTHSEDMMALIGPHGRDQRTGLRETGTEDSTAETYAEIPAELYSGAGLGRAVQVNTTSNGASAQVERLAIETEIKPTRAQEPTGPQPSADYITLTAGTVVSFAEAANKTFAAMIARGRFARFMGHPDRPLVYILGEKKGMEALASNPDLERNIIVLSPKVSPDQFRGKIRSGQLEEIDWQAGMDHLSRMTGDFKPNVMERNFNTVQVEHIQAIHRRDRLSAWQAPGRPAGQQVRQAASPAPVLAIDSQG